MWLRRCGTGRQRGSEPPTAAPMDTGVARKNEISASARVGRRWAGQAIATASSEQWLLGRMYTEQPAGHFMQVCCVRYFG